MPNETLVARWESVSGKHWVNLYVESGPSFYYRAPDAGGNFGYMTAVEAIEKMRAMVASGYFQPDANKTPMRRVR